MIPNRFNIIKGPSQHEFILAFLNNGGCEHDHSWFELHFDEIFYMEVRPTGLDYDGSSTYQFRGEAKSELAKWELGRERRRLSLEGVYNTHKREGWVKISHRYCIVETYSDEGDEENALITFYGDWETGFYSPSGRPIDDEGMWVALAKSIQTDRVNHDYPEKLRYWLWKCVGNEWWPHLELKYFEVRGVPVLKRIHC